MNFKTEFKKDVTARYEFSSGFTKGEEVTMTYNVWANKTEQRGGFEMYSNADHYAEGSLGFYKGELVDYDGVYSLDLNIIKQLGEWGFDVRDMKKSMEEG